MSTVEYFCLLYLHGVYDVSDIISPLKPIYATKEKSQALFAKKILIVMLFYGVLEEQDVLNRQWTEVMAVDADIQSVPLELLSVDMCEQGEVLPCCVKRLMDEVDLVYVFTLVDRDGGLLGQDGNVFSLELSSYSRVLVVPGDHDDVSIKAIDNVWIAKVAEVVHGIFLLDGIVPQEHHAFVHLFQVGKWAPRKLEGAVLAEMSVGSEKYHTFFLVVSAYETLAANAMAAVMASSIVSIFLSPCFLYGVFSVAPSHPDSKIMSPIPNPAIAL